MNIYSLDTKEKLDQWGERFLVVTDDIQPSDVTGNPRAVAFFHFIANMFAETITLVVGVYELDSSGNPIISKSLNPYEQCLVADNSYQVDENGNIVDPEDQEEGKTYMGEFDFYVYATKHNSVLLWSMFESIIKKSRFINPPYTNENEN